MDKIEFSLVESILQFLLHLFVVGLFSWLYLEYWFCVEMYYYIMWRCSIFSYGLLDERVRSVTCIKSTYVHVMLMYSR